ncbi:MAG: thioredoxin family protein [Comamonas sp.]|nr:thioredoxin family protein [Comamonas sp.]
MPAQSFTQRLRGAFLLFLPLLLMLSLLAAPAAWGQIQLKLGSAQASTHATAARASTPRVDAELVIHAPQGISPGAEVQLGLLLRHQPEWHTYWKNAGDSGMPTELQWQLPPGLSAGDIAWPMPQQIRVEDFLNFGYEGEVLLPVPLTVGADFAPDTSGQVQIDLHASWLVCRVECVPEDVSLSLRVPVAQSHAAYAAAFAQAQAGQPLEDERIQAQFTVLPSDAAQAADTDAPPLVQLQVRGLPAAAQGQELAFYPELAETFYHAAVLGQDWQQAWLDDPAAPSQPLWQASLPLSEMRGATPAQIALVLGLPAPGRSVAEAPPAQAWRMVAPVSGQWPEVAEVEIPPALAAALAASAQSTASPASANVVASTSAAPQYSLWAALVGGLLGGLLLNLMPCVFPVLAIKILGFAQHGSNLRAQRLGGLAYTLGAVLSFVALGGLLLGLRAAGEQLGWGFQLQSPWVVAALALLFTVLALNLAGLFEFGQMLPSSLASMQMRHPVADAFLSGVLAVAVASPCTAPFMGASLGFAVALPAAQALAIFAALGLGMALPYVLLSWLPALVRWLPRPGAWMLTFRQAMAFPMLATVVWLVWVLGQQSGIDGAASLLALLVAFAALVWAWSQRGASRWWLTSATAALLAWMLVALGPQLQAQPQPDSLAAGSNTAPLASDSAHTPGQWQAWSTEREQALRAQGQGFFVDYTAAWCVTCQYNKRTVLADTQVLQAFAQRGIHLLRADWTRRDPAITQALTALGRSGVPAYVLHSPGGQVQVLSEMPSAAEVLQALEALPL